MSSWDRIKTKLEADGYTTNGIGRRVQARACRHCGARVLAGADGDTCGRVCYVDPDPLDKVGEALAVLTGRYTVALWSARDRYELTQRDRWSIAGSPPPQDRFDVLAEHRCGAPALPTIPTVHRKAVAYAGDRPPF